MTSVADEIRAALLTGEAREKVTRARATARAWRRGELAWRFDIEMPERPAWPAALELLPPSRMPKRGTGGSDHKTVALWHSIAHIEFVAIDLALDMAGRFGERMGHEFVDDFLSVAADEAMHFALVDRKLRSLGSRYGALPVHGGLWEAAQNTQHDVAARLAVVPMVLEARALDVTPGTRDRVRRQGDEAGARILQRILDDEVRHVAFGAKHFRNLSEKLHRAPEIYWKALIRAHFRGQLKPPFNDSARLAAGLSREYYA